MKRIAILGCENSHANKFLAEVKEKDMKINLQTDILITFSFPPAAEIPPKRISKPILII